ncbi:MAG TPA: fibronectin type III domain-containing protein [Acidimicrobiales bacterium]|nr:fibronectin type III domain-containing protein [Acidimicrobiales bacterium]
MLKRLVLGAALGVGVLATMAPAVTNAAAATDTPVPVTPYGGFNPALTRAPYVTDLSQTSADVNWATTNASPGPDTLEWGPSGSSCTTNHLAVPSSLPLSYPAAGTPPSITGRQFTVGSISERQSTAVMTGLTASTTYCYRVFSGSTDLLGSNSSPTFTTLDPVSTGSSSSLTFDVVGDLGETNYSTGVDFAGSLNTEQAAIDSLIGSSGARFVVLAGDVAYPGGTQNSYGDLQQGGTEVSDIFGPSYWPQTGGIPTFVSVGNHGQNVDTLRTWPESGSAMASSGASSYASYPALPADGTGAGTYPSAWYAISTGNVRIYVLDAGWADSNVGTAPGGGYQVDYDQHWTPSSPEYQWLAADLASHPGSVKMAVFHFPLRSANSTQSSDPYLQNSSSNPNNPSASLEALLANNGVRIAFNGHAHTYQRIIPSQPGQVTSYVTGGGGGVLEPVDNCNGLGSIYALGWSPAGAGPTSGSGSSCGTATPQSAADVYNFLRVTVTGSTIVVTPTNAAGKTFDPQAYGPPTTFPSTPGNVSALATSSSSIQLNWAPSTEAPPDTITSYLVYRNSTQIATVAGSSATYLDSTVTPGVQYVYTVYAVDSASRRSAPGTSNRTATPTMPTGVTASATSPTSVQIGWTGSTETGGTISSYQIHRNGTLISSVAAPSGAYTDTTAQPGTAYTYTVTAIDGIGASSTPGTSNPVTTPVSTLPFTGPPLVVDCMAHLPAGSVVGAAALADGSGYFEVDSSGDVAAFGRATCFGAMTGTRLNLPIVGMAVDQATGGYWLVASDGGIFSFNAPFLGSTGNIRLNKPIVGMAPAPNGNGYWMVASDGGVFSFGTPFYGSTGNITLNKPIVGMGLDRATGGYWLVASDGGVFSFNAPFYGSTGSIQLNQPIVNMAPTGDGSGYRLVAADGGVFCFNAPFYGSTGSIRLNRPVITGLNDNPGNGYWLVASDGGVFSFNAPFYGSAA